MKYAIFYKIPSRMREDVDFINAMVKTQVKDHKKRLSNRGMVLMNTKIDLFEQDGDGFRENIHTVRILGNAFKIPRMVKPLYKNTFRKPTKIKISNRKSLKLYS